jgi:carbamoyl-phosphate synthase small subunit
VASTYNRRVKPARLILEDGSEYHGLSFGSSRRSIGEVVFNTSQTGYQEIATDPSYRFQIVVMTTPHIGNYGVESMVEQSEKPQLSGLVVRELSVETSQPETQPTLSSYLEEHDVPGISDIDTRALTRKIRIEGAMRGLITTEHTPASELAAELRGTPSMSGLDLVQKVTTQRPYLMHAVGEKNRRIAVYDFGVKRDILRKLTERGCEVVVYPATTHADELLDQRFDGVVLSNGPGDPEPVHYAQENIRRLIGKVPLLGICLGHQLLGLALGGRTYKLKFGHHGGNHPVKELHSGKVEITAQNHGFSVEADSLDTSQIEFTHVNLNDGTLEGFRHRTEPIIAVQYHPEAAPGPHDSFHIFDEFLALSKK